jgi:DNA (cytosine-5)-methyltransferase 1
LRKPLSTVTSRGSQQQLVAVSLAQLSDLSEEEAAGAERVAAFLMRYYGSGGQFTDLREPMATITTKARMALVLVHIDGQSHVLVDIGMRMLEPHELYAAQGFPEGYIFDRGADGCPLTKTSMIRMVGNSVCPKLMQALYESLLSVEATHMALAA